MRLTIELTPDEMARLEDSGRDGWYAIVRHLHENLPWIASRHALSVNHSDFKGLSEYKFIHNDEEGDDFYNGGDRNIAVRIALVQRKNVEIGLSEEESLLSRNPGSQISSSAEVLGGDHRIRETRVPVWMVVSYKKAGASDGEILENFPDLTPEDLQAAWEFYAANTEQIEGQLRRHEEAA